VGCQKSYSNHIKSKRCNSRHFDANPKAEVSSSKPTTSNVDLHLLAWMLNRPTVVWTGSPAPRSCLRNNYITTNFNFVIAVQLPAILVNNHCCKSGKVVCGNIYKSQTLLQLLLDLVQAISRYRRMILRGRQKPLLFETKVVKNEHLQSRATSARSARRKLPLHHG
jgi:hypothetical protein